MNEQVSNNPNVLANTFMKAVEKIRLWGNLPKDNVGYFLVKDLNFERLCLLPKIQIQLHGLPGRPV